MNIIENILAEHSGNEIVTANQFIEAKIDLIVISDVAYRSIQTFEEIGANSVHDPDKVAIVFDHNVPARNTEVAETVKKMKLFAEQHKIKNVYDLSNGGIQHVILSEKGLVKPGMIIIDGSHTCTDGALGVFATGVSPEDRAVALATGKLWFKVPELIRVVLNGRPSKDLGGMDVGLKVISTLGSYGANDKAIQFEGDSLKHMNMAARFTMCNLVMECSSVTGIVEPDEITYNYYKGLNKDYVKGVKACYEKYETVTTGKYYCKKIEIDMEKLQPQIACPSSPGNVKEVSRVVGTEISHAFMGYCTHGRLEDIRWAAKLLENKKVNSNVTLIVTPGSQRVFREANRKGYIEIIQKAGAVVAPPTCGACAGIHMGVLGPSDVAISTTNRNYVGRMGHPESKVYLGNPAVVIESAINGKISYPREI